MMGELPAVGCLSSLTAIVPLDLQFRAKDIIAKAKLMVGLARGSDLKIVFALNDRGTKYDARLKSVLSGHPNASLVSGQFYHGAVNSAQLRNLAFAKVSTEHVVLLDVDLWLDLNLLKKHVAIVASGAVPFSVLPCLYLSMAGSRALLTGRRSLSQLRDDYFAFSRKEFLHLANPSSILVMRSTDYRALGGFDREFSGHGYEDFDFMIRLASRYSLISASPDFLTNATTRSPLFVQGFRRELGRLCLEPMLDQDFFLHIFHAKSPESRAYYALRARNFSRFCELHGEFVGGKLDSDPTLMTEFIHKCASTGRSIQDFSIYFENKPGHVDRYDTLRRRVRFLLR